MKATLFVIFLSLIPAMAQASIFDRIESCEDNNGTDGCIYDILRELASSNGGGQQENSFCECRVSKTVPGRTQGANYYYDIFKIKVLRSGERITKRMTTNEWYGGCSNLLGCSGPAIPAVCTRTMVQMSQCNQ